MTSLKMETSSDYRREQEYSLNCPANILPVRLNQTVEAPEGDRLDLLAATEEDYNNVYTEIMGNAFSLMMKFY